MTAFRKCNFVSAFPILSKLNYFFHLFDTKTILAVAGVIQQLPRKQATYGLFILKLCSVSEVAKVIDKQL
jgi:hypothetical protein